MQLCLFNSCEQNLVRPTNQNQNKTPNEHVPKPIKMVHAFAECSQNQSKLQKLGWCSPSVRRTNQNSRSRNSVGVHRMFEEPIKTPKTRLAFAECWQNQSKLQKLGWCSLSVGRNSQNSRNSVSVRWVFAEPIKTPETRLAFAEFSQNQTKLQKLGWCSLSVRRTNQNSRNSVRIHQVLAEPIKTPASRLAFAECSQNQSKSRNSVHVRWVLAEPIKTLETWLVFGSLILVSRLIKIHCVVLIIMVPLLQLLTKVNPYTYILTYAYWIALTTSSSLNNSFVASTL